MSDASVTAGLHSTKHLVVIEAPAGCGKTYQGAEYARAVANDIGQGRVLVLAHTHAACDEFSSRTCSGKSRVEVRTIDSLICEIASAYHLSLSLPQDVGGWARRQQDGYDELAQRLVALLRACPMIARTLAIRYPVVICDEHQDASAAQHELALTLWRNGTRLRVFGDPMQAIYSGKSKAVREAAKARWHTLQEDADVSDVLDTPHRWDEDRQELAQWILGSRNSLHKGGHINLASPLPAGISVLFAENQAAGRRGGYSLTESDGKPIYSLINGTQQLLVLSAYNQTVDTLRAFFARRLPIWEGHVRNNLDTLVDQVIAHRGKPMQIATCGVDFLSKVTTGFSPSTYGNVLVSEVASGCQANRRGKPAELQSLGKHVLDLADHRGLARMFKKLHELVSAQHPAFRGVKIDYSREFWDAIRLGAYGDPEEGLAELSRRRTYTRQELPAKAISTIHKAKGLECDNVIILPCDGQHFGNSETARYRLYVAMSRAKRSLTFVVSRTNPSPIIVI